MSDPSADPQRAASGHDRRDFLRRVGVGAAVAGGAWIAPQVVSTTPAWAACSPIPKFLQVFAAACNGEDPTSTPVAPLPPSCVPSGWINGRTDGIDHTCSNNNLTTGGTITITEVGCTPTEARAVRVCPLASGGPTYACVNGTIVGNVITFASLVGDPLGCVYVEIRIKLSCCT